MTDNEKKQGTPVTPVWIRKRSGLTQRQASDLIGVRESTISEWERGVSSPSVLLLPKIMNTYQCTADEVIKAFENLHKQKQQQAQLVASN
ncbi:helix-turn-helix transcriptional regulator [Microcoleus sp. bin38.metabat.b11b12b14.051]|uniref:helix-turn-helix domain-containing protein n=1 Tax=Microcoleus sp. bin38.metabat.b11b12b14.051 TaxID=2742709 RepID=UPI0025E2BA7E|nr:helix-turn-helix transcriptional regulator [Microcoleus sp. bin38.metabat.b11b12b14.051]